MQWHSPAVQGWSPSPRHFHSAVMHDDRHLYVFGGWARGIRNSAICDRYFNNTFCLSLDTWQWHPISTTGDIPSPRSGHAACMIPTSPETDTTEMVIFGGGTMWMDGSCHQDMHALVLHPSRNSSDHREEATWSGQWRRMFPGAAAASVTPSAREGHSWTRFNGGRCAVMFGGFDGESNFKSVWIYHAPEGSVHRDGWWELPRVSGTPPAPRCYHSAAAVDDRFLYVVGGSTWQGHQTFLWDDVWVLDVPQLRWTRLHLSTDGPCWTPRFAHGMCLRRTASNPVLYLHGGWTFVEGEEEFLSDTMALDPVQQRWHTLNTGSVIGDGNSNGNSNSNGSNTEEKMGPRYGHTMVSVASRCHHDGTILVLFGGADGLVPRNDVAVLRDPRQVLDTPATSLPHDMGTLLSADASPSTLSDIVFVGPATEGHPELPCHRAVLAARCERLAAMMRTEMTETMEGRVRIPEDTTWDAFRTMIGYLYTDTATITEENAVEVYALAHEYSLPRLQSLCENYIAQALDPWSVSDVFMLATKLGSQALRQVCLRYAVEEYRTVRESASYLRMDEDRRREVDDAARLATAEEEERERMRKEPEKHLCADPVLVESDESSIDTTDDNDEDDDMDFI
eukprot:gb/GECH01000402.1/.p1 GENE.gb/GECH01000402.1/~~gb/GECH01000402.1/.p1  ORF type:complete len:623 (+),score=123.04 gb/GECH01000402.1/:1-1869(+)